jgi:hypothetical protein
MRQARDLSGQRFGRWTVIERDLSAPYGAGCHPRWWCRCDCGTMRSIDGPSLSRGMTKSCRCIVSEITTARNTTHGGTGTPEYWAWTSMIQRCTNPKIRNYSSYGGRGISVCPEWMDFATFLADMGMRPSPKHSIERRDNSAGYSKANCYWATKDAQNRNTRQNHKLTYNGQTKTITEWARDVGLNHETLCARINLHGWSIEEALTTPVLRRKRPH